MGVRVRILHNLRFSQNFKKKEAMLRRIIWTEKIVVSDRFKYLQRQQPTTFTRKKWLYKRLSNKTIDPKKPEREQKTEIEKRSDELTE